MKKIIKTLDIATDKLARVIQLSGATVNAELCEAQQILIDLLISLNPRFGL